MDDRGDVAGRGRGRRRESAGVPSLVCPMAPTSVSLDAFVELCDDVSDSPHAGRSGDVADGER